MIKINNTNDDTLVKIHSNRMSDTETLWDEVEKSYKQNKKMWENKPAWLESVPRKRSKVRDNRIFLATESQINKVTSRPMKPMVLPANDSEEAVEIGSSLQDVYIEAYRTRNVKKHMKRGLRFLHFSKLMCLKVFWNSDIDDFDVKTTDSKKVRFSENSTNELESEFAIEEIDDKTILQLIDKFPDQEDKILNKNGLTKEQAIENNPKVKYHEMWIGDGVCWIYEKMVLKKQLNPYFDNEGLLLTAEEMAEIKETEELSSGGRLPRLNGRRRREMFAKFKGDQKNRGGEEDTNKYETYLYNHFDTPRKPYIFGTVLEVEDKPIGEVTLIEMVTPLQIGVDKRKRQIDDNSDMMNGITKVDTDLTNITKAQAMAIHYDPEGMAYGPGVSAGITRETGVSLPSMVFEDMKDSRGEIDEIFGTTATFRGTGDKNETATGRAILREEGLSRLSEVVDLVDYIGFELYNWWYQMIRVNYTESHLVKIVGKDEATKTIDLMQDDLQDGIEIKIIPGQTLPEDKVFRAERAREDVEAGLIDPVTYLRMAGGYDNPEEVAKRAMLFKTNPFSLLDLDGEDLDRVIKANQLLSQMQPQSAEQEGGGGGDPKQIAQMRKRIEQVVNSPEFKKLTPEEQKTTLQKLKEEFAKVGGASGNKQTI